MALKKIIRRASRTAVATPVQPPEKPYKVLKAWHAFTRQSPAAELAKAREQDAPDDAMYLGFAGAWITPKALEPLPEHPFHAYLRGYLESAAGS